MIQFSVKSKCLRIKENIKYVTGNINCVYITIYVGHYIGYIRARTHTHTHTHTRS